LNFVDQAKYWLDCFWDTGAKDYAEDVWQYVQKMSAQNKKAKEGMDLDEFEAHKFIESLGETLTVIALRERLREIDVNSDKKMALVEYLLFKYGPEKMAHLCTASLADKTKLLAAQKLVEEAQASLTEALARAETARVDKLNAEAKKAEAEKAEAENKAALAELKAQEDAYHGKIKELEALQGAGGVKGAKAVQDLFQLKAGDPLPLQRAKITQEATVRKSEKARKAATEAAEQAAISHENAEKAARDAEASVAKAEEKLEEIKKLPSASMDGSIWYMQRDIKETKKYLPKHKQ